MDCGTRPCWHFVSSICAPPGALVGATLLQQRARPQLRHLPQTSWCSSHPSPCWLLVPRAMCLPHRAQGLFPADPAHDPNGPSGRHLEAAGLRGLCAQQVGAPGQGGELARHDIAPRFLWASSHDLTFDLALSPQLFCQAWSLGSTQNQLAPWSEGCTGLVPIPPLAH